MAKPEWGIKRKCLKCGMFFYDMRKEEFSCPKCHAKYTQESYQNSKNKQLLKLAKKTIVLDEAELDEETLLKLTEDVPLTDEENLDADTLDVLEDDSLEEEKTEFKDFTSFDEEDKGDS